MEVLFRSGMLPELYGSLRAQVSGVSREEIQDAVSQAVLATLVARESDPPEDLAGYLFIAAKRWLLRTIAARGRVSISDIDPNTQADAGSRPDQRYSPKELYDHLKKMVAKWDNERMRTIIELLLDAAYEGVSLRGQDLADAAEEATGEPYSLSSVFDWKKRGISRLYEELEGSVE
jgi:hypothetical protein